MLFLIAAWIRYKECCNLVFELLIGYLCNRTPDEVFAAKGVKPTLSPNLDTLALVEVGRLDFLSKYF